MYTVKPKGLNLRLNDRDVPDGFLQESINLQWRDGALRPIPERLSSGISDTIGKDEIIMHKVSDEDKINVLMFDSGVLKWYGTIENGVYTAKGSPEIITGFPTVTDFDSLSFTILNSLVYFMSKSQEFYYRLEFNETDESYEIKDMYAWKDLVSFYPRLDNISGSVTKGSNTDHLLSVCGVILIRFTLVLKTGEEVLHSPIYANYLYSINRKASNIEKDDLLTNIHTLVNTNLEYINQSVFDEEISAINIYASTPFYVTKVGQDLTGPLDTLFLITDEDLKGETQRLSENPFYLVKTINKNSETKFKESILFYVGDLDLDIEYTNYEVSKINMNTIAAGAIMPVDNFSYHKLFGRITSQNGRLIVDNPKTVLSIGHIRSLCSIKERASLTGFYIDTEDGTREGVAYEIDTSFGNPEISPSNTYPRGILSYPDSRANFVGGSNYTTEELFLYKSRANKAHNMSCVFNFEKLIEDVLSISENAPNIEWGCSPSVEFGYGNGDIVLPDDTPTIDPIFYTSENRLQFSEVGEFSVWPAINSYRVGEGKILFVGDNSVDPANTDYIAPLLIGTSDGVYTVNFDVTGVQLIQSITKAANMPALSSNNIQIDQNLIYVSDKGLIVVNSGQLRNITRDYFPEQGNGDFPTENTVFPNYDLLIEDLFGGSTYELTDIIDYLKGAVFAYDGRRNNLYCCNPNETFSLVYNIITRQWGMSTYVFSKVVDYFGLINSSGDDIYSRYLTLNDSGVLDILSGENNDIEVDTLLLTRPIKMESADVYKKIDRLISRCELYKNSINANFILGIWGKQDINKKKINIPLIAIKDDTTFENDVRQDIPIGRQKGKYKTISILQGGRFLPDSSISMYEITAILVNNKILR